MKPGSLWFAGALFLWAVITSFGTLTLLQYEAAPGTPGTPPSDWPTTSHLLRPKAEFALVMLAHPNCPCTQASLAELEIIMTHLQGKVAASVVFNKPGASASELHESDNWQHTTRIPGVLAIFDDRGTETQHFGGHVSGQTMLYSPEGRLVFSGGITAGRGHQGNNIGAEAVIRIVRGDLGAPRKTPVFGCSLHNPSAQVLIEEPSWKK